MPTDKFSKRSGVIADSMHFLITGLFSVDSPVCGIKLNCSCPCSRLSLHHLNRHGHICIISAAEEIEHAGYDYHSTGRGVCRTLELGQTKTRMLQHHVTFTGDNSIGYRHKDETSLLATDVP